MIKGNLLVCLTALMLIGCTATPSVKYKMITKPADLTGKEFDTYFLRGAKLRIDKSATKEGEYEIQLLPIEAQGMKIGLIHSDGIGVTTNLVLSKVANTDLVSEIGVTVSDKRIEYIKNVAEVIKTAIPLIAGFAAGDVLNAETDLPYEFNLAEELPKLASNEKDITIKKPGVQMKISAIPPDSVGRNVVFQENPTKATSDFFFSACRSITVDTAIKDKNGNIDKLTINGKIADPQYLQRVELPIKGKVAMHSQCGVSVSSDTDPGVSSSAAIAEALATQGKAIKDAIDAAKKK